MNTLTASLVRYQQALEDAIRSDLERRRRRSRAVRLLVAGATASALALGVLAIVSSRGPSTVQTARAAVLRHATAALALEPGMILHVSMTGTQTNPHGPTVSWSDESWQQLDAPFARRQVETGPDGKTVESATGAGGDEVYDPTTNTIYVSPPSGREPVTRRPTYRLAPGRRPGTFVLRLNQPGPSAVGTVTISAAEAKRLRKGTDVVAWMLRHAHGVDSVVPAVIPRPSAPRVPDSAPTPDPDSPAFRDQILALLRSGGAHVGEHVTIDGRDTIEIAAADGHTVYYVDAGTYAPVELDTNGDGGGTKLHFSVYEELPAEGNGDLLSLTDQHPTATVDRDPASWRAAQVRLFPHG